MQTPHSGQIFIQGASTRKYAKFQLPISIVFEIKRVSLNLMSGLLTNPLPVPRTLELQGKTASQISALYLYASCSYVNMYFL